MDWSKWKDIQKSAISFAQTARKHVDAALEINEENSEGIEDSFRECRRFRLHFQNGFDFQSMDPKLYTRTRSFPARRRRRRRLPQRRKPAL